MDWVSKRLGINSAGGKLVPHAFGADNSKSLLDGGTMSNFPGNSKTPTVMRETFKTLSAQFTLSYKTEQDRALHAPAYLKRVVDTFNETSMKDIVESATCSSEVRNLISLATKSLNATLVSRAPKDSIESVQQVITQRESLRISLRVFELLALTDNHAIFRLISGAGAFKNINSLFIPLSCTTKTTVVAQLGPGKWDENEATFRAIAKSMSEIIRSMVRKQDFTKEIDVELLFKVLLTKPTEKDDDTCLWLQCARNAINYICRSDMLDMDLCGWIMSSKQIPIFLEQIKQNMELSKISVSAILFSAMVSVLKESFQLSWLLIEEFETLGGYEIATKLLWASATYENSDLESVLLRSLDTLAYIGSSDDDNMVAGDVEIPFQHVDFHIPVPGQGPIFRNQNSLEVFKNILMEKSLVSEYKISALQLARIQSAAVGGLLEILKANPINYFIISRSNIILCLVEGLDQVDIATQAGVMEILRFIIIELNYVPFKELALLFVHLQGSSSSATIKIVSDFCCSLLDESRRLKDVFRELGLLSMFSSLFSSLIKKFSNSTENMLAESPSSFGSQTFVIEEPLIAGFMYLMQILQRLIQNYDNMQMFRSKSRQHIIELIRYAPIRAGVFLILEELICGKFISTTIRASTVGEKHELQGIIEALGTVAKDDLGLKLDILGLINKALSMSTTMQHAFQTNNGFESLLISVSMLNLEIEQNDFLKESAVLKNRTQDPLVTWFETFILALRNCPKNRQYVEKNFNRDLLTKALSTSYIKPDRSIHLVIGGLFGLAYESFDFIEFFDSNVYSDISYKALTDAITNRFQATPVPLLRNVQFIVIIFQLLEEIPHTSSVLINSVLGAIQATSMVCKHNQTLLCSSGIMQILFSWLFNRHSCWFICPSPSDSFSSLNDQPNADHDPTIFMKQTELMLVSIAKRLLEIGISDDELQYLLSRVDIRTLQRTTDKQNMLFEFLLHGLRYSRSPYYLHFDGMFLGPSGYLTIPDYHRSFPPISGYTFMAWVRVERLDTLCNTEIMSIFDPEDKERLCIAIEPSKSKRLVVRTIKTTCVFENFVFRERQWTHIALVHQKPRITASSIQLYVNGVLTETAKCGYLGHPGTVSKVQTYIGTRSDNQNSMDAECHSIWDLGPTYFIEEVQLSASEINTIYENRFNSVANWQGYLSNYQKLDKSTHAAAVSHIEDETSPLKTISFVLSPTKAHPETLDIPEDKILFSLCASNSLDKVIDRHSNENGSGLAIIAARILPSCNALFNSAIPKPRPDEDVEASCVLVNGEVLVVCTNRMIDGIWKLGGCAVLLKLIEISTTSESLYQSVSVLIESLEYNWRNAAEMEKCHFFEILSHLIKSKRDLVTIAIMDVLLILVGRTLENSENSTLINGQALRHLFLDVELWRTTPELQRYFLTLMTDFIVHSSNRDHNIQKLNKMAMIKRILLMLKSHIIPIELLPDIVNHLKIFLKAGWSPDTIKSVCTYLMYTLPKEDDYSEVRDLAVKLKTQCNNKTLEDAPALIVSSKSLQHHSYGVQVRNYILEMLFDILSEKSDNANNFAYEFSRVSSSRWIILFCGPRLDLYSVTIACRIFAKLWISHDMTAPSKFKEGCLIMARLLQPYSNVLQIYPSLLAILCGLDVSTVPLDMSYDVSTLMAVMKPLGIKARRNISPDIMRVISSLLTQTVRTLSKWSNTLSSMEKLNGNRHNIYQLSHQLFDSTDDLKPEGQKEDSTNSDVERATSRLECFSEVVQTTLQFIGTMYRYIEDMKDSVCRQEAIDDIVGMLFRLISTEQPLSLEKELMLKDSPEEFDKITVETLFSAKKQMEGTSEILKLQMRFMTVESNNIQSSTVFSETGESMFAISDRSQSEPSGRGKDVSEAAAQFKTQKVFTLCNTSTDNTTTATRGIIDALIELILTITVESILGTWKPLQGLDMALKAIPPSSKTAQKDFQCFLLLCTINSVYSKINKRKVYVSDTRVLANIGKLISLLVDKIYQGVFTEGPEVVYDFVLAVVDIIQTVDEENTIKVLRTDFNYLPGFLKHVNRLTAYYFGYISLQNDSDGQLMCRLLDKIIFYQKVILSSKNSDAEAFKMITHHMLQCLLSDNEAIQTKAIAIWKQLLLQKPSNVSALLRSSKSSTEYKDLIDGFSKILEVDSSGFLSWLALNRGEVLVLFQENATRAWDIFCQNEIRAVKESGKAANKMRYSKLKKHYKRMTLESDVYMKYLSKSKSWLQDTQRFELDKFQRFRQDYVVMLASIEAEWIALSNGLLMERAIWGPERDDQIRWKLDFTEAKARMRRKMRRNHDMKVHYQSKFEKIQLSARSTNPPQLELSPDSSKEDRREAPLNVATEENFLNDAMPELSSSVFDVSPVDANAEVGSDIMTDLEANILAKDMTEDEPAAFETSTLNVHLSTDNLQTDKDGIEPENDWEEVVPEEDQNRKILRLLEPGDEIVDTINCARLVGLELCEGLCILCQENIYLVDNYFRRADSEIVDIDDVPGEERNIYHLIVTGSKKSEHDSENTVAQLDEDRHTCRKCSFEDIKEVHKRLYLFRNVALEIFIGDGRNFLLTFWSVRARDAVYNRMINKASLNTGESVSGIAPSSGQSVLQNVIFGGSPLAELTQKWCSREISNFAYLMHLNTMAGRSYNDLTQYPVFPWIIADYDSEELDLTNPAIFRDLSKPMGGQGATRASEFIDRFNTWDDPNIPGCHYGTHYSSSMIVCSYLIRLEPFTQQYLKLQGGHFDHPDRLFHSIAISWASASRLNTTDVRELIPEFFYLPDFLKNANKFEFGTKQTGEVIDHVFLPPWAKNDPNLFIQINREALESEYVSAHLHEWVDLIFGFKQQGSEAAKSVNVFHYLSYEGAVDIDKIEDPVEKQATIGIIHNFGQTPRQLFKKPHPKRTSDGSENQYKIHRNADMLIQAAAPIKTIANQPISDIWISPTSDKIMSVAACKLFVPPTCNRYIEWDYLDDSLRLCQTETGKVLVVFENLHIGHVSCAAFSDQRFLVTGGSDMSICISELTQTKRPDLKLIACMRGHRKKVLTIAVSRAYSLIVSGGEDCVAIIWDLNRQQYTRTLFGHSSPVTCVAIHEGTGDIITCCSSLLKFWNVNGDLLISKAFTTATYDPVTSCAFYEGRQSESFDSNFVFIGHKKGHIKIWSKVFVENTSVTNSSENNRWDLKCIKTLEPHTNPSAVTVIRSTSSGRFLLSGDATGRVNSWMMPDGSGTELHFAHEDACMSCNMKFSVLERKGNCRCCGGSFCLPCMATITDRGYRMCHTCYGKVRALAIVTSSTTLAPVPSTPITSQPENTLGYSASLPRG